MEYILKVINIYEKQVLPLWSVFVLVSVLIVIAVRIYLPRLLTGPGFSSGSYSILFYLNFFKPFGLLKSNYQLYKRYCENEFRFHDITTSEFSDFNLTYIVPYVVPSHSSYNQSKYGHFGLALSANNIVNKNAIANLKPIHEHFKSSSKIAAIRAPAGFGKTSLCKYIGQEYSKEKGNFVFYIKANELITFLKNNDFQSDGKQENLYLKSDFYWMSYIVHESMKMTLGKSPSVNYIRKKLIDGAIIIVDGLDEVSTKAEQKLAVNELFKKAFKQFENSNLVLVARDFFFRDFESELDKFISYFNIEPLDQDQIFALAEAKFNELSDSPSREEAIEFIERIQNRSIKVLSINPLLLSQMLYLYIKENSKLPENKYDLIGNIIFEAIKRRIDLLKNDEVTITEIIDLLKYVYEAIYFENGDIKDQMTKLISQRSISCNIDAGRLISFLLKTGMLHLGGDRGVEFLHKSIEEYQHASMLVFHSNRYTPSDLFKKYQIIDYDETLYYFCLKHPDLNAFFNSAVNDKGFSVEILTTVYVLSLSIPEINISNANVKLYKSVLNRISRIDSKKYSELSIKIKLERLKHRFPYTDDSPLKFSTVGSFFNRGQALYNYKGDYVSDSGECTQQLISSINSMFADVRGHFELPTHDDPAKSYFKVDTLIKENNQIKVFDPNGNRFKIIKNKFDHALVDLYKNDLFSDYQFSNHKIVDVSSKFIIKMCSELWCPNVLFVTDKNSAYFSSILKALKKRLPPSITDPNQLANYHRNSEILSLDRLSYILDKTEYESFEEFACFPGSHRRFSNENLYKFINHNHGLLVRKIAGSRGLHDHSTNFERFFVLHMKLLTYYFIRLEKMKPWGRIQLTYKPFDGVFYESEFDAVDSNLYQRQVNS